MTNRIFLNLRHLGRALACVALSFCALSTNATDNFLKADHERGLEQARKDEATASSTLEKVLALQQQAEKLNSLGHSAEALTVINRALEMLDPPTNKGLFTTKATILFSLNDPQGALTLLTPQLEMTKKFTAASKTPEEKSAALSTYTNGLVTATFAYMQLEQWRNAIDTLADAEFIHESPSFYAYKSLIYRYIMARTKDPSLSNARLEKDAAYYTMRATGHYGALLRMWQGEDTITEISEVIGTMKGLEQQDALGEALFYSGAYAKFVQGDAVRGKKLLDTLNREAPYGTIEWVYGKRVLQ